MRILITGGYHTDGIEAQLRKAGITYICVFPQIGADDPDVAKKYQASVVNEYSPFAEQLAGALYRSLQ